MNSPCCIYDPFSNVGIELKSYLKSESKLLRTPIMTGMVGIGFRNNLLLSRLI